MPRRKRTKISFLGWIVHLADRRKYRMECVNKKQGIFKMPWVNLSNNDLPPHHPFTTLLEEYNKMCIQPSETLYEVRKCFADSLTESGVYQVMITVACPVPAIDSDNVDICIWEITDPESKYKVIKMQMDEQKTGEEIKGYRRTVQKPKTSLRETCNEDVVIEASDKGPEKANTSAMNDKLETETDKSTKGKQNKRKRQHVPLIDDHDDAIHDLFKVENPSEKRVFNMLEYVKDL